MPMCSRRCGMEIDAACRTELADAKQTLQEFLRGRNPAWHLVGRVHFNLAENRSDEEAPFAFIATYTTRLSAQARAQHLPLAEALREYAGAKNKARLLSLLKPVQEGCERVRMARGHGGIRGALPSPQMVRSRGISILDRCAQARGRRYRGTRAECVGHGPTASPHGSGRPLVHGCRRFSARMRCSIFRWS